MHEEANQALQKMHKRIVVKTRNMSWKAWAALDPAIQQTRLVVQLQHDGKMPVTTVSSEKVVYAKMLPKSSTVNHGALSVRCVGNASGREQANCPRDVRRSR
jgi:hypothetical protein